jgi:cyclophilin family peptidyl-prolyl cis-trans isomerase
MLDEDYTVFGEVISGLEVIDTIASVQTATGDRPVEDVKMSVKVIE